MKELVNKIAIFFGGEDFYEKGEEARLEFSPSELREINNLIIENSRLKEKLKNTNWHTGTPTESGEYLVCRVPKAGYLFRYNQLCTFGDLMGSLDHNIFYIGEPGKDSFENITDSVIAWQKIEPLGFPVLDMEGEIG